MTFDTEKAGKYLCCSGSRITELVACGAIRGCKVGRGYVFKKEWLDAFLEEEADRQMAESRASKRLLKDEPAKASGTSDRVRRKRKLPDLSRYDAS